MAEKRKNAVWTCEATCKGSHGGRLAQCYELARALVNCDWSMKTATFSTRDLQEQCRKSYVASYWANEELVISQIFSCELRQ